MFIKTKDTEEAAFYWTLDNKFKLENIESVNKFGKQIMWFCFSSELPQDEIKKIQSDYNSGQCLVEPRKYSYRRQEIKRIIHDRKNMK